jgi:small-conductance mechanosensitive channel
MIVDALSKAGISIPFPQRDIHFDRNSPLQVSVVAENNHNPVSGIKPKPKG